MWLILLNFWINSPNFYITKLGEKNSWDSGAIIIIIIIVHIIIILFLFLFFWTCY